MLQIRTSSAVDGQAPTRRHVPIRTAVLALGAAVAVALTLPAAGTAAVKPNAAEKRQARSACIKERGKTRVEHRMFRAAYGVGRKNKRALRTCVKRQARMLATRRAAKSPPGTVAPPAPVAPPGFVELPGVRADCQLEQMEDPIGFGTEYPGPNPLEMCVQMESAP